MFQARILFLAILLLGLAASAAFRAAGAVSEKDALFAAAAQGTPLSARYAGAFIQAVRTLNPGADLFPVLHQAMGSLLALAAAVASLSAFQACGGGSAARVFAGIMVGTAILFGSATGIAGTDASSIPMVLVLLSAATISWLGSRPRAFAGGILLGLAVVEHPAVFLTLPGFLAMVLGVSLRAEPDDEARLLKRAGLGFLAGLAAILLKGSPESWVSGFGITSPLRWFDGIGELLRVLVTSAGPLGFAAGLAGIAALFQGHARRARPFLLIHSFPAAAMIFGRGGDRDVLAALAAWSFLYFFIPAIEAAVARFSRARVTRVLPAYALLSSAILFLMNRGHLDRTSEKDLAWARDSFDRLTENGLLLTANPVHWALAADGERSDLDVVYVDDPASLQMHQSPLGLAVPELPHSKPMTPEFLAELIAKNISQRQIFFDPALFFRTEQRTAILGDRWQAQPFGLAFRIAGRGEKQPEAEAKASGLLWANYEIRPDTPKSPLRDGLTGNAYYARSLLQSAALYAESAQRTDAEREFLLAMTLEDVNPNLAALGLARVFFERQNFEQAVNTLSRIRDDREGAWLARKILGATHYRLGHFDEARREIEAAMRLTPPEQISETESMQRILEAIESGRSIPRLPVYERIPDP
jgi:tetratricopeptide (TPR) repeat protein